MATATKGRPALSDEDLARLLELAKDAEQDGLTTITLSYTMYPVRQPEPRVERGGAAASGRS